ncbi:MAG: hypothetical protein WCS52_17815 [bacterium]
MKKGYDFSKGVREKFFRPDAKMNLPVYLDSDVLSFVEKIASSRRSDISAVVNRLLKSDMQLIEAAKYSTNHLFDRDGSHARRGSRVAFCI